MKLWKKGKGNNRVEIHEIDKQQKYKRNTKFGPLKILLKLLNLYQDKLRKRENSIYEYWESEREYQ